MYISALSANVICESSLSRVHLQDADFFVNLTGASTFFIFLNLYLDFYFRFHSTYYNWSQIVRWKKRYRPKNCLHQRYENTIRNVIRNIKSTLHKQTLDILMFVEKFYLQGRTQELDQITLLMLAMTVLIKHSMDILITLMALMRIAQLVTTSRLVL